MDTPINRSRYRCSERGSFMVAGALFLVVFMLIGGIAVDLSRYFAIQNKLQSVAEGAALAGGRALNQFRNQPNEWRAYEAALDYIEDKQGPEYRDLYEVKSDGDVDGIIVKDLTEEGSGCDPGFKIGNGQLKFTQSTTAKTEVLGSGISAGANTRSNFPVSAKVTVTDTHGHDTSYEPWGDYDDAYDGNLNQEGSQSQFQLSNQPKHSTITATAKFHQFGAWGNGQIAAEKSSTSEDVLLLQDGDQVPGFEGGHQQKSVSDYVSDYVNPNTGKISLRENQAIFLFELTHNKGDARADYQDLVLLMNMAPGNPGGGSSSSVIPVGNSTDWGQKDCMLDKKAYRVGVVAYEDFEPFFLPRDVFGDRPEGLARSAVAQVTPTAQAKTESFTPNCGLFADERISITGNNLNAGSTNFCGNSDVFAGGSANGTMNNIYHYGGISTPGGSVGEVRRLQREVPVPDYTATTPSGYDVELTSATFNSWPTCGSGNTGGNNSGNNPGQGNNNGGTNVGGHVLQTKDGNDVVWSGGGDVCVSYDGTTFSVSGNNQGSIQKQGGSAVSIHTDGSFAFQGNGLDVDGGLYATGNITVTGNNHAFNGDPSVRGGLALWAEGNLNILMNNISMDGILGSGGDLTLGSNGGGTGPDFQGIIISDGRFTFPSNSNNARISHDTTRYSEHFLNMGDWRIEVQEGIVSTPTFAHVNIRLIGS